MRLRLSVRTLVLVCLVMMLLTAAACQGEAPPPAPTPVPTPIPTTATISVVGGAQTKSLSCESQSASDLAKFWGKPIGEIEFLNRLPRSDNPQRGFVGSPDDPAGGLPPRGYGVYAAPVAETLRAFGLNAEASQRKGVNWLRQEVAAGRPVIVWATYGFKDGPVKTYVPRDGQQVPVVQYEHTFLAVGYDTGGVWVIDALDGQRKHVSYADFDRAWSLLGQMAVSVRPDAAGVADATGSDGATAGSLLAMAGRALSFAVLALVAVGAGAVAWRARPKSKARRRRQRLAQTAEFAVGRVMPAGASPRRSARRQPAWSRLPALGMTWPSTQGWAEGVQHYEAQLRREALPLLRRAAAWRIAQPLPLALIGIGAGLAAVAMLGWISPCVSLPIVALGAGVGFWLGVEIQSAQRDGDDTAPGR